MKGLLKKLNPAVKKPTLVILAGILWFAVGVMLVTMAAIWLKNSQSEWAVLFALSGFLSALVIHHFGFLRIVDKNLGRIKKIDGKYCAFGFMPWKSYILIAIMMTMGILLRHSGIPKDYLSIIYLGIGTALALSSARYFHNARKYASED